MQPAANESAQEIDRSRHPRRFWPFTARQAPGGAADPKSDHCHEFISYLSRRVVGTIAAAPQADAAVAALLEGGFERQDVDVLHGEEGLRRLEAGTERGLLAQVQRSLVRSLGDVEATSLERHVGDLRRGKFVVLVRAKGGVRRRLAANVLSAHGAEFVGYYGRWFWELLDARPARLRQVAPEGSPGQTYEVAFDDASTRLRFQSGASATVTATGRAESHAAVMRLRPGLSMLTWKSPEGTTVVQIHDYDSCRAYGVLTERDGTLRRLTGTIRRLS